MPDAGVVRFGREVAVESLARGSADHVVEAATRAGHTHGERRAHVRDNRYVRAAGYGNRPRFVSFDTDEL
jgi:hypothetical protein